jgi:maltose O-acetyltransferase
MIELMFKFVVGLKRRVRYYIYKFILGGIGKKVQICKGVVFGDPKNIFIGSEVVLNEYVVIQACEGASVKIGDGVHLSYGSKIITGGLDFSKEDYFDGHISKPIELGRGCWLGANAIILPGVQIGANSIVAAGAVVTKDVGSNSIVAGIPARMIGVRDQ